MAGLDSAVQAALIGSGVAAGMVIVSALLWHCVRAARRRGAIKRLHDGADHEQELEQEQEQELEQELELDLEQKQELTGTQARGGAGCYYIPPPQTFRSKRKKKDTRNAMDEMEAGVARARDVDEVLDCLSMFDASGEAGWNACPICLEQLGQSVVAAGACKHAAHVRCITSWLLATKRQQCPVCRSSLVSYYI